MYIYGVQERGSFVLNAKPHSLTDREKEHGLIYYVVLSRVTKFSNLGMKDTEGISKNRLCRKIPKHSKMEKHLIEEERLHEIEQHTLKYFN